MKLLLEANFWPSAFHCVWIYDNKSMIDWESGGINIRPIEHHQLTTYVDELLDVQETKADVQEQEKAMLLHGEGSADWIHYLAYENDVVCGTATLLVNGRFGYLAWGYTNPAYRGRGIHKMLVRQRVVDAVGHGCETIFSVSDVTNQSGINLQKCGFRLAYNYLIMTSPY